MSTAGLDIITKYFDGLEETQLEKFERLPALYEKWNSQINVISRKDIEHLPERHLLHSLSIGKFIQFKAGTSIMDVGTGGGFPGIPLAILFPQCHFHLVDSIGKKIQVVSAIAEELGLNNVTADQTRAEQVTGSYDFITSRAVTGLKPFLQWVRNKISQTSNHEIANGVIALKGGDLAQELSEVKKLPIVKDISDYFDEDFFQTKKIVYLPMVK